MAISRNGMANLIVDWPAEHKVEAIAVSVPNDGKINGQPGAVVSRGDDGRFRFEYQAGAFPGSAQVILRAANISYSLNFWVPTGNPNVDPPTLQ